MTRKRRRQAVSPSTSLRASHQPTAGAGRLRSTNSRIHEFAAVPQASALKPRAFRKTPFSASRPYPWAVPPGAKRCKPRSDNRLRRYIAWQKKAADGNAGILRAMERKRRKRSATDDSRSREMTAFRWRTSDFRGRSGRRARAPSAGSLVVAARKRGGSLKWIPVPLQGQARGLARRSLGEAGSRLAVVARHSDVPLPGGRGSHTARAARVGSRSLAVAARWRLGAAQPESSGLSSVASERSRVAARARRGRRGWDPAPPSGAGSRPGPA